MAAFGGEVSHQKYDDLGGFKKALRDFSVKAPKPHSGPLSERFCSDSEGVCPAVTLTFGP